MLSDEQIVAAISPLYAERRVALIALAASRDEYRAIESAACSERDARIAELDRSLDVMAKNTEAQAHASVMREIELTEKVEKLTRELEEARKDAIPAMRAYAAKNPRFLSHEDVVQDPNGVHAWLEKHAAAIKEQA